ncbi:hypothetical protein ONE63_010310 [Megalurothrips usitatus]|uniref:Secreted protein n=1 Tax=Megalurothrips usitatus TaxID=439358 RepID=A0AAV7XLJ7_9NEOP|nr:hypothetical protein ONE63_010310 [Megalurothrips usitatus]
MRCSLCLFPLALLVLCLMAVFGAAAHVERRSPGRGDPVPLGSLGGRGTKPKVQPAATKPNTRPRPRTH